MDHRDLSCSGCKLLFCEQCTGLSKSVYAYVRAGELGEFLWSYNFSFKNTLPTLKKINSTLKEIQSSNVTRFKNIEDRLQIVDKNSGQEFINNIKKDVAYEIRVDISTVVNNQLKEYEDIRKRELNIIMFNVQELEAQGPCPGHRSSIAILYCFSFKYMKREKGRDQTQYTNLCGLNTLPH